MIHGYHKLATQIVTFFNNKNSRNSLFLIAVLMLMGCSLLRDCTDSACQRDVDVRALRRSFISSGHSSVQLTVVGSSVNHDQDTYDPFFSCDRSHPRTDVCVMKGDVRVDVSSNSVVLFPDEERNGRDLYVLREERIRPYTRKWESNVMQTIDEVSMSSVGFNDRNSSRINATTAMKSSSSCDVKHDVPAIVFSTGGYTGNVYHEFNDGLIPLFMTAYRFKGDVVFMILDYHDWWMTKYGEIVRQLTNYQVVDFSRRDGRVHCVPEVVVGLLIHNELAIDSGKLAGLSMLEFQQMLNKAYQPRLQGRSEIAAPVQQLSQALLHKPRFVLISRKSPRAILNQDQVVELAEQIGFLVQVISPRPTMEVVDIYAGLHMADVVMGVHGAAMTHLVFLRPGCTFIQVVPLGTDWAAWTYYGEPALKLGLKYVEYKVSPQESTLSRQYASGHPVLRNPDVINQKGWPETKRIYLDGQDINLSLPRIQHVLHSVYSHTITQLTLQKNRDMDTTVGTEYNKHKLQEH